MILFRTLVVSGLVVHFDFAWFPDSQQCFGWIAEEGKDGFLAGRVLDVRSERSEYRALDARLPVGQHSAIAGDGRLLAEFNHMRLDGEFVGGFEVFDLASGERVNRVVLEKSDRVFLRFCGLHPNGEWALLNLGRELPFPAVRWTSRFPFVELSSRGRSSLIACRLDGTELRTLIRFPVNTIVSNASWS